MKDLKMPKDYKTTVTVEHKARGFDKVSRDNNRYIYALSKMRTQLSGLKQNYKEATREIDKLSKALEKQNDVISKNLEKQQKRGAFLQGLAQGGFTPAMFLQRGPGMPQQMAGMAIGRTFRTGMAGVGGSFTGVQGLQQFLGSIPGVGGFLSGQVGKLAGYADQNINYQRTKLEMAPYLSTFSELQKEIQSRGISKSISDQLSQQSKQSGEIFKGFIGKQLSETPMGKALGVGPNKMPALPGSGLAALPGSGLMGQLLSNVIEQGPIKVIADITKSVIEQNIPQYAEKLKKRQEDNLQQFNEEYKLNQERIDNLKSAKQRSLQGMRAKNPLAGLATEGARLLGMNKEETLNFLGSILQAGGGVATGEQAKGIRQTAFGAKTLFGVQGGVSGAFLKAGRRGGIVGGMGKADNALKQSINEGISLGLSGSEINQWLQQIASGIYQFQQTGIGINVDSISKLATDIGRAGLPITRAINMAQGITQYLQGIGSKGISSGADLMMLRELGGFRGGGVGEYRKARSRLEELQFQAKGMGAEGIAGSPISGALRSYMQNVGGDQATKAELLQRLLQRWGVKGSVQQFDWLAMQLMGGPTTGDQGKAIADFAKEQQKGQQELAAISKAGGISGAAARVVSARAPNLRAQAEMQNRQIDIGGKAVSTMQAFERNALKVSGAFINLAEGPLKTVHEAMSSLTDISIELANQFVNMLKGGASVPW
jgi:hypothetical protein